MKTLGLTWNAVVVQPSSSTRRRAFVTDTFGVAPVAEMDGVAVFDFDNGTRLGRNTWTANMEASQPLSSSTTRALNLPVQGLRRPGKGCDPPIVGPLCLKSMW